MASRTNDGLNALLFASHSNLNPIESMSEELIAELIANLVTILLAGFIAGVVCRKLNVSLIIGYLIVGTVIGHGGEQQNK